MFKKLALQIRMVNPEKQEAPSPVTNFYNVDAQEVAKAATEYTFKTIGAVSAAIAAHKVLNTICEVAVIAAKAKLK